ncbi:alpha/beta hydrolase [Streptomyces sp. A7024]|uniref:Alpha/beta hydrolase n=1 Tax=Streptomyces coryli TaxID=1128680 RepID=A0A6G4TV47_9ACTN|nr:dienelactone hydrolase family protein [Streptomyces coryli]NGN63316.1 alpha/beta hydrolase [Streptomyces coryli]
MPRPTHRRRLLTRAGSALAAGGVLAALLIGQPTAGAAEDNPHERGPAPTQQSIEAEKGPFEVDKVTVPGGDGFAGGTIYFPKDTSKGKFGGVAISPGFMSFEAMVSWYGPRLASQGFVVFTIGTFTPMDIPSSRADQLLASLKFLVEKSPAKDRVDGTRLALMGHSMGGGGTLHAAARTPGLQAAIPLTPWELTSDFSKVQVPTLVFTGQADFVAPASMGKSFYQSIPDSTEKGYVELAGGSHFDPLFPNVTYAKYSISWLKRFVDNDTRYDQFLCPVPKDPKLSAIEETCPLG